MIKRILLLGAIVVLYESSKGQTPPNTNLTSTTTLSPNASSAGYGENISVDPYTGKLQTGFTLFSYSNKSSGLVHQINLSYQGGGIRVADIASSCGLGWSIGIDASITRIVNSAPDDISNPSQTKLIVSDDEDYLSSIAAGSTDAEYDEFYYTAGQYSGKFIVGQGGTILMIPKSNVKVEIVDNGAPSYSGVLDSCRKIMFKLTIPSGTKYFFASSDCGCYVLSPTTKKYHAASWSVTDIVSAFDKDTIHFSYQPVVQEYSVGKAFVNYTRKDDPGIMGSPNYSFTTEMSQRTREMRLQKIRYPDGAVVDFHYESQFARHDLKTDSALRE